MTEILDSVALPDAICQRINCRNIGAWLEQLALDLGVSTQVIMPTPPVARHEFFAPERGLRLVLGHPHAGYVEEGDIDRWIISEAQFIVPAQTRTANVCQLPFDLDAENETPQTAQNKLDGDSVGLSARSLAQGNRRQSYFLDNALIVEITWRAELCGIERVWVVRMGSEMLEPPRTS
ncbi:hypothetical protein [Undibacterium sp. Ren11W]|uniref:hypothetical protein n=1 Tax=Undibacterium sp. Ren11W TaxID=3413045 RepID=UPI003BF15627